MSTLRLPRLRALCLPAHRGRVGVVEVAKQEVDHNSKEERRERATLTNPTRSNETRAEEFPETNLLNITSVELLNGIEEGTRESDTLQNCAQILVGDTREGSLEVEQGQHTSGVNQARQSRGVVEIQNVTNHRTTVEESSLGKGNPGIKKSFEG